MCAHTTVNSVCVSLRMSVWILSRTTARIILFSSFHVTQDNICQVMLEKGPIEAVGQTFLRRVPLNVISQIGDIRSNPLPTCESGTKAGDSSSPCADVAACVCVCECVVSLWLSHTTEIHLMGNCQCPPASVCLHTCLLLSINDAA